MALVRSGVAGLEVFMVKRHTAVAVMAGAYVFPGGQLSLADSGGDIAALCDGVAGVRARMDGVLDDELSPEHLVFMIIGLAAWWVSAPQVARMLTGADDSDPAEHARRRASVVTAAERLARPRR